MNNSTCAVTAFSSMRVLLAPLVLALVGCSHQAELPPQVSQDLVDLRDQLLKGKAQVQTASNAARDLTQRPQAQLQPQIDRLIREISALDSLASNNRQQFASAEEHAKAYFNHWDQQMEGMNRQLAEAGKERRIESERTMRELKTRTEALKKEFRPFMTSLLEVARYLQTDTTASGVKVVTPQIKETLARENTITAKADAVIAQIDAMRGGK